MSQALGQRVKRLRETAGLSQEELAARAGVSKSTVQNIESGERTPRPGSLSGIARALGIDVPALMRDENKPASSDVLEELLELRRQLDAAIQRLERLT